MADKPTYDSPPSTTEELIERLQQSDLPESFQQIMRATSGDGPRMNRELIDALNVLPSSAEQDKVRREIFRVLGMTPNTNN